MAGGELLVSIVLALGAGVLLANPAGYLAGLFNTMETTSAAVLSQVRWLGSVSTNAPIPIVTGC